MAQKNRLIVIGSILFLISFLTLTACGSDQETVTYKLEEDNNSMETTFVADDGEIIEQSSRSITSYDSIEGVESQEEAEALLVPSAEPLQGIEGLEYNLDFEEDHFTETITIDFAVADLSELPGLDEVVDNEDENLNLDDAVESLEEQGFEKVKE
ncbi:DUF1307 domain-containing protein [Oceanobacillus timonensis]|uniref:DUF1307 domain-containing protein n=1 Tax=Oceanobacillus timonensis TaxID=1926285 RepID=UPI0009BB6B11|nr:DUF1307 domain-containing protein [Oceanobacillus timonensis]